MLAGGQNIEDYASEHLGQTDESFRAMARHSRRRSQTPRPVRVVVEQWGSSDRDWGLLRANAKPETAKAVTPSRNCRVARLFRKSETSSIVTISTSYDFAVLLPR